MGLSITRAILGTYQGRITVESKPGDGQGLGIVKDIAELYGGEVRLGRSLLGGLRVDLILPAAIT